MLLRLETPDAGQILFQGRNLQQMVPQEVPLFRRLVGVVLQDIKFLPGRSVFENAALPLEAAGKDRYFIEETVPKVLRFTGLADKLDLPACRLTAVEKQRLAIARAMANDPPLFLVDEPTGTTDGNESREILGLLQRLHVRGAAVVVASGDPAMPTAFPGSRQVKIDRGRLVDGVFNMRSGSQAPAGW
jgi:cell division transport system ATP-binding protein